ncbi:MAG: heavy-metal-associated domain-containing protein [Paraclostridium sp.]
MKKTLLVNGMSCMNCVRHLREALEEDLQGVEVINISLDDKCAVVDIGESITDNMLRELIEELGYELENIE